MSLFKLYHPPVFQGNLRKSDYFEGWYFKQVSADHQQVLAIIPGISLSQDPHAFIQLIDGKSGSTNYLTFPVSEFKAHQRKFEVIIGKNYFSDSRLELNIDQDEIRLSGEITFPEIRTWPVSLIRPGIMGWYRFVPYMECYHGVVSVNHRITGSLSGPDHQYRFDNGYGYIEKDWGTSFPEQWIWLHANCFPQEDAALMVSVAKIPWRGRFFVGFIGFLQVKDQLYRFFTYNRSKLVHAVRRENEIELTFTNRQHSLAIKARQLIAGELKAPVLGNMDRYIKESIDSEVHYVLKDRNGEIISQGTSAQAGLEIVGDVISLL